MEELTEKDLDDWAARMRVAVAKLDLEAAHEYLWLQLAIFLQVSHTLISIEWLGSGLEITIPTRPQYCDRLEYIGATMQLLHTELQARQNDDPFLDSDAEWSARLSKLRGED